ncbi:MAG: hypothetical protein JSU73_05035 [candidate division WOR-3 bacterium]|nr:MAG: hypothetical protein JSU73_05035 [candidate division WOR-3 bacterium]
MRFFVLAVMILAATAPAQTPQYAFVVVVDGIRNDEGFEAGPTYLRHIWNDLRPLGTVNRKFWNRGWTATTSGHTAILSGVRQFHLNNEGIDQLIRGAEPMVFECFRDYRGEPESACGVIVGKWGNCGEICDFGLEPALGADFRGFQIRDPVRNEDTCCSRLVHEAMDSLHPKLVLVNLATVDEVGHTRVYEDYLAAIRVADSIVWEFWKHIQAQPPWTDTFYRDRTVLIVTADHGRNDGAHGGFAEHGQWDHGCRDLIFLALGPGIASGRTVDTIPRDQIDIAPTLAAILEIPVPFAQGEVMTELFADGFCPSPVRMHSGPPVLAQNISANAGFSRDPDLCRDRFGNLHLVWSDNSDRSWFVDYAKSTDQGQSWQAPRRLFDFPYRDSVMWYARVAADDSLAVAAMGWGKHACRVDTLNPGRTDTTYVWYPWIATSINQGTSWTTMSLMDSNMGGYQPAIAVARGRQSLAWGQCGKHGWETTTDGIHFNDRVGSGVWDSLPTMLGRLYVRQLSICDNGVRCRLAACALRGSDWDILYGSSLDRVNWHTEWVVQDPDGRPVYDFDPEIEVDGRLHVHMVWARKPNQGGNWRVMYGRRDPMHGRWDTTSLSGSGMDAWQPDVAVKGDTVAVVWTDYREGNPEVYACFSVNRGLDWSRPENVSGTRSYSHRPRACALQHGFYVVWQDLADGDWDIYGKQVDVVGIGEERTKFKVQRTNPTIVRGVLRLQPAADCSQPTAELVDVTGRRIMELEPGENDVRHVAPGIYFITPHPCPLPQGEREKRAVVRRIVVQR